MNNKKMYDSYYNLGKKVGTKEGVYRNSYFLYDRLDNQTIEDLLNFGGIIGVAIEAPVADSFLTGVISESNEIKRKFSEYSHVMRQLVVFSRAFGGAYLYKPITQSPKVLTPLDINIEQIEMNPLRDDYLMPTSATINETGEPIDLNQLLFVYENSTPHFRSINNGLGASMIERIIEYTLRYDVSLSQSTDVLAQLNQSVIAFQDLNEVIGEGREDDIIKRLDTINTLKSNLSILAIDNQDEFYNVQKTVSGVRDIIQENAIAISSVTKIPYSRLFGKTVTGIGNINDNDMINYYDTVVTDIREYYIKPIFNKLLEWDNIKGDWKFDNIIKPTRLEELQQEEIYINNRLKLLEAGIISEKDIKIDE